MTTTPVHSQLIRPLSFREELRIQRFDDHRYYHQSRINQSLHLLSAVTFLAAYLLLLTGHLGAAVLMGWLVAMCSRQAGHFFFEPRDFDRVNNDSHDHKEQIKVGYNLRRKRVLHALWAAIPVVLLMDPDFMGLIAPAADWSGYAYNLAVLWLWLAAGAIVFRVLVLTRTQGLQTGLVWATKILTDPFNDFRTYLRSPLYLARGELLDPMDEVAQAVNQPEREAA